MMISDVRMPGLTGLDTLRQVRREFTTLPVLLVTAYADIREAVIAMRDGAVNYLAKPIDLDELLDSVHQATGVGESAPLQFMYTSPVTETPESGAAVPTRTFAAVTSTPLATVTQTLAPTATATDAP